MEDLRIPFFHLHENGKDYFDGLLSLLGFRNA